MAYSKLFVAILFTVTFRYSAQAQTMIVDPAYAGGFELGSSFADNGWTVSNGANNPWVLGQANTTAPFSGYSAYISVDGSTPGYLNTAPASNFFWRDIVVPAGQERVNVSFNWLSGGETNYDLWQVFFVPVSTTPAGSIVYPGSGASAIPSSLPGAIFVGSGTIQTTVQTFNGSVFLPAGSYRIVFHWKSDNTIGTSPGASIDNISVSAQVPATFTSVATGNWSAPATWSGGSVPSGADNVIVDASHIVTIDAAGQAAQSVTVSGTLTYGTTPTEFQAKDLTVNSGGLVNVFSGTIGKSLRVSGNLVNNGRVNTLANNTVANGTLNLNGTAPQTVSGTGVWGGTVSNNLSTNEVGVIGILSITNNSTAIPNINYTMGGTLRIRSTLTLTGAMNLNGATLIRGNFATIGSLLITGITNGGFSPVGVYNGTYGHWWTNVTTGTVITAGIEPSTTTSLFPMLDNNGLSRRWIHISRTLATGSTAGEMLVSFEQGNWFSAATSVTDTSNAGSYVVSNIMGGAWKISTANGYAIASTASHMVQVYAPNLFRPANGNLRLLSGTGPDNTQAALPYGRHQAGTYTPSAQRVGLTTAMLTNSYGFVLGYSSADLCAESVSTLSENFDSYPTANTPLIPFCWSRVVTGTSISAGMSTASPVASGALHMLQYSSSTTNNSFILLPPLTDNLSSVSSAGFRLKFKARISTAGSGLLEVGYLTGASNGNQFNPGTFVNIANVAITNTTYGSESVVNIPAGIPQGARLAIANRGTSTSFHYWDDVVYEALPSCTEPSALVLGSLSSTGMQFTFTAPSTVPSNGYDVYYSTSNTAPTAGTAASTGTNATGYAGAILGLIPNTVYFVWIRSNCGASGTSPWAGPLSFATPCIPSTVPFSEGFETGFTHNTPLAGCWSQVSVTGFGVWTANSSLTTYNRAPRTGTWNAFLQYSNEDWLMRSFNLTGGTSYTFEMYARQDMANSADANITVAYGSSNTAAGMTNIFVPSTGIINGNYQLITGMFTPPSSGVYFVGIKGFMNGTPWYISIDDISLIETPACMPPSGLTSSAITNNSATLGWSASASSNNYEVAVQAAGSGAPSGAGVAVTGTSYAATGLNAATNYEFYVRTVCPSGNSPWAGPFAFSTAVCAASATCNYTINMTDTYGDGWDGTVIGLRQSGILVGTFGSSFTAGNSATATVALCPGLLTEIVLVTAGSYPEEKRFTIVDPLGVQVYALTSPTVPLPSTFGTFTSSCTPPACAVPTGLASSAVTASGATISWTAGGSETSWEISIQAPGLGAPTGNGTSITTNPYVATGLTSNTSYQVYLRSVCLPTNKSNWVGPVSFHTLCNVFTMPFFESFETAQGTASCWSGDLAAGSTPGWQWIRIPTGSAPSNQTPPLPDTLAFRIPFYSIFSGSFSLNTPVFVASAGLSTVSFNYAYAAYSAAENDQLEILGSTDGGTTYTTLELMNGGPSGPLNTAGTTTASFVPTVSQWGTKTILLPAGTNRVSFKGISAYGNNLYIDNVRLAEVPPCLAPSNVAVASSGISARGASVSWDAPANAPANGYGLYVSTTNTAPVAGTVATSSAASSPAVLSGLTPNTTYYVWVRSLCAYNSSDWTGGVAFSTSCDTSAIPFAENFDALTPAAYPGVIPTCWSRTINVRAWRVGTSSGVGSVSAPNMVWTTYDGTLDKNDWMYTPSFALNAGISYSLRFRVRAPGWAGIPEKLAVYVSGAASPSSMTAGNKIYENLNLMTTTWVEVLTTFTPATSGTYYIGWHAFSVADVDYIAIDNVSLGFTPPSPIAGVVRYGNTAQTPLSNVVVTLWNTTSNTVVESLTTNATGAYSFTPGPGSFEVRSSTTRTPGGWNATGALAIGRHYANVNPLQGLYLTAADVTANNQVNASDALQVLLRYLTVTNSFAAGNWVFEKPAVNVVQGATVPTVDITGLSVGDVRGAFTPGARLTTKAKVEAGKDDLVLTRGQVVRIPVYLDEEIDLGAISLSLGYDARQLEVLSVRLSNDARNANLVSRIDEPGVVSLAWFDVQGWNIRKGSALFELECLVKDVASNGVAFRVMEGSELASREVEVLDMASLRIPNTRGAEGTSFISLSNYPNPFEGNTSLRFSLPAEGSVVVRVLDVAGRVVTAYDLGARAAGVHTHDLELNVQSGVYSAELLYTRGGETSVAVARMISR